MPASTNIQYKNTTICLLRREQQSSFERFDALLKFLNYVVLLFRVSFELFQARVERGVNGWFRGLFFDYFIFLVVVIFARCRRSCGGRGAATVDFNILR